jgi:hypothetical protein
MKATARTVCETSQVYIIMQMVIYMTENGWTTDALGEDAFLIKTG